MTETSPLSTRIDALRGLVGSLETVLSRTKESTGAKILGFTCDFLPFEVLSAYNIHPLVLPRNYSVQNTMPLPSSIDFIVHPENCCRPLPSGKDSKIITIPSIPGGYGEDAASHWATTVGDFITRVTGLAHPIQDPAQLTSVTEKYNEIRRMVRGIAALRVEKPYLMSNKDLECVFEAALCLPFDILRDQLSAIRDALNSAVDSRPRTGIPALAYGGFTVAPGLLDDLESAGFAIVEDDICGGRRSFDLSHNSSSTELYAEILNAFSFRPFCPCLRDQASRFELLYKLLGSYGIETVILIEDEGCPARGSQVEYLRVKLMRAGIDPLVLKPGDAVSIAKRYVERASL